MKPGTNKERHNKTTTYCAKFRYVNVHTILLKSNTMKERSKCIILWWCVICYYIHWLIDVDVYHLECKRLHWTAKYSISNIYFCVACKCDCFSGWHKQFTIKWRGHNTSARTIDFIEVHIDSCFEKGQFVQLWATVLTIYWTLPLKKRKHHYFNLLSIIVNTI